MTARKKDCVPLADSKQRFCSVCLTYRLCWLKSQAVLSEVCHSHQLRKEEGRHIKLLLLDILSTIYCHVKLTEKRKESERGQPIL